MNALLTLLALSVAAPAPFPPLLDRLRKDEKPAKAEKERKEAPPKKDDKARRDSKDKKEETPPGPYEVVVKRNLAYRSDKDADPVRHKLDIYTPQGEKDFPVVLFVHGGGWHSGNKDMYAPLGQLLARNGVGAVLINYRLSPKFKHPTHAEDVAKAFAWTRANIAKFGGRADRIVLMGHSAGGHLVSLLATDDQYLRAETCSFKDIRGVVSISGAYAIDSIYGLYTSVFGTDRSARKEASPRHHVSGQHPPILLLYAEKDLPTIEKESERFYDDLKAAKCDARIQMLKNRTHISIILMASKEEDPVIQAVFDFLEQRTEWHRPVPVSTKDPNSP